MRSVFAYFRKQLHRNTKSIVGPNVLDTANLDLKTVSFLQDDPARHRARSPKNRTTRVRALLPCA